MAGPLGGGPWCRAIEPGLEGQGSVGSSSAAIPTANAAVVPSATIAAWRADGPGQEVEQLEAGLGRGAVGEDVEGLSEEQRLRGGLVLGAAGPRAALAERWRGMEPGASMGDRVIRSSWCTSSTPTSVPATTRRCPGAPEVPARQARRRCRAGLS